MASPLFMVTIVIVSYNRPLFLERAIDNAIAAASAYSSPNQVEIIVIDDSDVSVPLHHRYYSNLIHHILDARTPTGSKRNIAASMSRGQCIVHWDDDDVYDVLTRLNNQCDPIHLGKADITALEMSGWVTSSGDCFQTNLKNLDRCHPHWGTLSWRRSLFFGHDAAKFTDSYLNEDFAFLQQAMSRFNTTLIVLQDQPFVSARHKSNSWRFSVDQYSRLERVPCKSILSQIDQQVYGGRSVAEQASAASATAASSSHLVDEYDSTEIEVRATIDWGLDFRPIRDQNCIWTTIGTKEKKEVKQRKHSFTWEKRASSTPFGARHGQLMFGHVEDGMVLCGGYSERGLEQDCWISEDQGVTWSFHSLAPWGQSLGMSAVTMKLTRRHDDKVKEEEVKEEEEEKEKYKEKEEEVVVAVVGGCSDETWYAYVDNVSWRRSTTSTSNEALPRVVFPILIQIKDELLQFGGFSCDDESLAPSDVLVTRSVTNDDMLSVKESWTEKMFKSRVLAGVAFQDAIIAVGIKSSSDEKSRMPAVHVVWKSSDGGKHWETLQENIIVNWSGGGDGLITNFALVAATNSLFILGGSNTGTASKAIHRSDDGGKTWSFAGLAPWKGRWSFGHLVSSSVEEGTAVIVVGGFAGWKVRYSDVWSGKIVHVPGTHK